MADNETNVTTETNEVGQLQRSALLQYLLVPFSLTIPQSQAWYLIGKHVNDLSVNLNADVEKIKNILDETAAIDNGYEPEADVDTYYANPKDGEIYTTLKNITMNRSKGEACMTKILEILVDNTTGTYQAWTEDVMVKPTSYGGAPGGVRIPFNIAYCGNREEGTATLTKTKVPTYTPPAPTV